MSARGSAPGRRHGAPVPPPRAPAVARLVWLVGIACLLGASGTARSAEGSASPLDGSFRVANLLPTALRAGLLPAPDPWAAQELAVSAELASHFVVEQDGEGRQLFLDGETQRLALSARFPVAHRSRPRVEGGPVLVGLGIDGIRHDGGTLDGFIEDFHAVFGFPNAGRERVPRDQLRFRARDADGRQRLLAESATEPGRLHGALVWPLGSSVAAHGVVAVPLGDTDAFAAADGVTAGLGLSAHRSLGPRLYAGGSIAVSHLGGTTFAADRRWSLQGLATVGLRLRPGLHLRAQLDAATPFSGARLEGHGDAVIQATAGAVARIRGPWSLELSLAEDPSVDSAPDVVFQLRVVRRP